MIRGSAGLWGALLGGLLALATGCAAEAPQRLLPLTQISTPSQEQIQRYDGWTVICRSDRPCEMTQPAEGPDGVRFSFSRPAEAPCDSPLIGALTLPHGLFLGRALRFDVAPGGAQMPVPVRGCFADGCLATVRLANPLRQRLRKGLTLTVRSTWLDGDKFVARFSLRGFIKASAHLDDACGGSR